MRRLNAGPDTLGEGPMWNVELGRLEWVDVLGENESSSRPDGSDLRRVPLQGGPASFAYRAGGGRIIVTHHGLILEDGDGSRRAVPLPGFDADREWFNDSACDAQGRLFVGSLASDFTSPHGKLYRLDPDLSFAAMDTGFIISNGIAWSPDGRTLYFADTRQAVFIYEYDVQGGTIGERRVFATFEESDGHPDGLAVDVEGCVWIATPGRGTIVRFTPDGAIERRIATPTLWPTSAAFGGPGLETLFVTSMRPLDGTPVSPEDGWVYAFEPGVAGLAVNRFGG